MKLALFTNKGIRTYFLRKRINYNYKQHIKKKKKNYLFFVHHISGARTQELKESTTS